MEIIQRKHQMNYYTSRLLERYFPGMKLGVFDIETTGLNPSETEVVLFPNNIHISCIRVILKFVKPLQRKG